ncbi:hypothetical protein [Bacillus mycoides]|nr:hypothetical protein [Bacillus mycoides]
MDDGKGKEEVEDCVEDVLECVRDVVIVVLGSHTVDGGEVMLVVDVG